MGPRPRQGCRHAVHCGWTTCLPLRLVNSGSVLRQSVSLRLRASFLRRTWGSGITRHWSWAGFPDTGSETLRFARCVGEGLHGVCWNFMGLGSRPECGKRAAPFSLPLALWDRLSPREEGSSWARRLPSAEDKSLQGTQQ